MSPLDPRRARSRKLLVDAAAELLGSGGSSAATVDSIIKRANVSRATLYRQFANVDEVIAAAFCGQLPHPVRPTSGGSVRERLVGIVIAQARMARRKPAVLSAMCWVASLQNARAQLSGSAPDLSGNEGDEVGALRNRLKRLWIAPFDAVLDEAAASHELGAIDRSLIMPLMVAPVLVIGNASVGLCAEAAVDAFLRTQGGQSLTANPASALTPLTPSRVG